MRMDRAERWIAAPAERIYQALTTRDAVERWLPPEGARGVIHAFEPRPGGPFRMTLVFDTPGEPGTGKTTATTDEVNGQFLALVPHTSVRQSFTFVSDDPAFAGVMTMTWTLEPGGDESGGGTRVAVLAERVPPGIRPEDHQQGMASSLANLARHVEGSA